jgi:hypothetical protein
MKLWYISWQVVGPTLTGIPPHMHPGASVSGFFMTHRYESVESDYLFEGTFEQAQKASGEHGAM